MLKTCWSLLAALSAVTSFDVVNVSGPRCFSCSVFTFINSQLVCANPATCASDFCYLYLVSDGRSMFLSGCAEDVSDFPIRHTKERVICQTRGPVGLCICRSGDCGDVASSTSANLSQVAWHDNDAATMNAISHRVTGFSADYARNRVGQMRVEEFPETFPGVPISQAVPRSSLSNKSTKRETWEVGTNTTRKTAAGDSECWHWFWRMTSSNDDDADGWDHAQRFEALNNYELLGFDSSRGSTAEPKASSFRPSLKQWNGDCPPRTNSNAQKPFYHVNRGPNFGRPTGVQHEAFSLPPVLLISMLSNVFSQL
ncbi:unnamed protein product [Caenorhabditis auriculariae]|uniref:Uncharacterized protein n=1 Tax=Caenorhabditis auriculariae TaxID=2777116 RepID=A0A8S1HLS1_9PELO|nr:unnamed protein product [Caenorhabditis auriculariae]